MQFHVQRNHILLPPGHSTSTPNDPCARRQLFWGRLSFAVAAGKLWMLAAGWSEDRWTVSPHSESMDTGPQSIGKGFLMSNAVRSTEGCGNWESPFFPIGPTELEPAIWGFYSKDKQGLYSVVLPINQQLHWTANMCTIDLLGICLDQRYDPIRQSLDIQPAAAMKILALADSHDWRTTATRSMGHVTHNFHQQQTGKIIPERRLQNCVWCCGAIATVSFYLFQPPPRKLLPLNLKLDWEGMVGNTWVMGTSSSNTTILRAMQHHKISQVRNWHHKKQVGWDELRWIEMN